MQLLLDTNMVLFHLLQATAAPFIPNTYTISVVTEAELLRLGGIGDHELADIEHLLAILVRIPVTSVIARRAALLGRTRKTRLPDLLIAATALELGIPLLTKNTKDFKGIPDLRLQAKF